MLFHRGPAEILAVNTCMKHLKPLRFIGLVSADTAPAVKIISVCTQTPAPFSRHGNAYRADAPHTLRTAGAGRRWWGRIESLPRSVYSSWPIILFFFSGCLSFPGLSHPSILNAIQRLSCFPPLPQRAKPHQAGVRVESCHSKSVCLQIIYGIKGK